MICDCGRETAGTTLCEYVNNDGKLAGCATTLAFAVTNVAAYYEHAHPLDLRQLHGGTRAIQYRGRIVGGTPTMPATQARWDAWATVVAWCRIHMEERPPVAGPVCHDTCLHTSCAEARRRAYPKNTIPSMARYLARQHRWTISQPWAPDMLDELLNVERRLRSLVDIPAPRWYAGRCLFVAEDGTVCDAELYATTERGTIACPTCGITHDVTERRDYLLEQAADRHVTATTAASALIAWTDYDGTEARLVDRIRRWRTDEALEVQDVTSLSGRDRHLYRLGDIQTLLLEHARYKPRHKTKA